MADGVPKQRGHRILAAVYDPLFWLAERRGLAEMRAEIAHEASGRVLELGAGTGASLDHYGDGITDLVLSEPDPHMARRLRRRLAEARIDGDVVEAGAESLPFDDASFDTVVSMLVLCTVSEPSRVISEIARVLRPGGLFVYLEHVRAPDGTRRARWQDRLERPWGAFAGGCHPNRDTGRALRESPLTVERERHEQFPLRVAALLRPMIIGAARRPEA